MADNSVSIAKITRPVLTGNYPRKRLFRLIDKAKKRQILWISGPPGAGKTTLVSSYLEARRAPGLWYRMDEGDADPSSFFHYLGLAAKKAAPRFRRLLPVLTPEQRPAVTVFARRFFETVFAGLKPGAAVVFDDYQKVPDDAVTHALIREGLSLIPPGLRVILVSREEAPPTFARLRAGQFLETIDWKELRLDARETEGIARLRWKGKRRIEAVRRMHNATDGWAAGLVLLLEKADPGSSEILRLNRHTPREIFDYFAGEILENLEERMQAFLLKTAYLPRMTARMAERLTGQRGAGQILSYMNRHNYFTEMHPDVESVYEFHPLFREFLLSRGGDLFSAKFLDRFRTKAAAILKDAGHEEEAAELLREMNDWEGLARIIGKQAPVLFRQGRIATIAEWLDSLPAGIREKDPWLFYWSGVCRLPTRPTDSQRDFEEAFRRFRQRKNRDGILLSWAGVVDSIVYGAGSLKALDTWISSLEKIWKVGRIPVPEEIDSQVTGTMIKALALRRPSFLDCEKWADRAANLARQSRDVALRFNLLLNVANFRFHSGDLQAAGLLLDSLRGMIRRREIHPLSRLTFHWLEAAHANMSGQHDRSLRAVSEGFEVAGETGVRLMDFLLTGHAALSSLHLDDQATAKEHMRKMVSMLPMAKPWEASFYHYLAAWEALHREDQAQALLHSDHSFAVCEEVGNPWTEALTCLQRAFVFHQRGEAVEASRHLERARRIGKESGMLFVRFACLLSKGFFALARGDEAAGLPSIRDGLRIGREKGYMDIYLWRPGMLERIAAFALEKGIETEYVRELIRRNALVPDAALPEPERWPWPLKLYTLGSFDLLKEDKPPAFSRKVQHKPLLMLKALVALGGREIPEERITDILWPEADGDQAHQSFATTLGRLRKLLRDESAVMLREGRVTLDSRRCWVDAFAFESLLARIDAASHSGAVCPDGTKTADVAREAVALYRGPFLAGDPSHPWITAVRERLRSKFLRAVAFLGGCLETEGKWKEAIACYRKGLEVDDLAEGFYQRLMICHQRAGQFAETLAVYERCRRALSSMLGIMPSAETEAIAQRVRSS